MKRRTILAGGSGFIGTTLAREFTRRGHEVVILTRTPCPHADGVGEVAWDGKNSGDWVQLLDGAETIVNLTGKNINCPHTPENLRQIIASRVDSVNAIAHAITQVKTPPRRGFRPAPPVFMATPAIIYTMKLLPAVTMPWQKFAGNGKPPSSTHRVRKPGK